MKTRITAIILIAALALTGCSQADRASRNVSVEADNFRVVRRLTVINTVTDQPIMEMVGNFSIKADIEDSQLEITAKEEDGTFRKHFVGISPTVTYVVEDISGADVSAYRYQISYLPEAIIPIELKDGSQ